MARDYKVNLSLDDTATLIHDSITNGSFTGCLIDQYNIEFSDEVYAAVYVYDKFYHRASNRLTLTVTIDNIGSLTNVHCVSGGGGQSVLKFSWFADESFEDCVEKALRDYIVE